MKQSKNKFFTVVVSMLIGAIMMILLVPSLFDSGILNLTNDQKVNAQTTDNTKAQAQNITVDVSTGIIDAINKVSDAVVEVINYQNSNIWSNTEQSATGSGVIYKQENGSAYIVTNNHVVEGANSLEVLLSDGTKVDAHLVGKDPLTDLAVIKINDDHVKKVATFGSSDNLKIGEPVVAIGNPLGTEFAGSATQGIVSGLKRSIPIDLDHNGSTDWQTEVIQTDAAINPGNSGGALVNIQGQVIGINSMKIAQESVEGIGFAIPVSSVKPIIQKLENYGEVKRPFIGIESRPLSDVSKYHWDHTLHLPSSVDSGLIIVNVVPMSPAEKIGLKSYDVITDIDGNKMTNLLDLRKYLYGEKEIGDKVTITYYRDGVKKKTELTLSVHESQNQ